mgnify:CR=1 FL=1
MSTPIPNSSQSEVSAGMGLRAMLSLLIGIALLTACGMGALSFFGTYQSGNAVTRAFVAKDVTADILPPPLYLIEMRLVLSQAVEGSIPVEQASTEVKRLQKEYTERAEYWRVHPPYGLEAQLLGAQDKAGQAFMAEAATVLALLAAGDDPDKIRAALEIGRAHV